MYSANNNIKRLPETETEFKLESITGYLSDKAVSKLVSTVILKGGFTVYDLQSKPKQFVVAKTGFSISTLSTKVNEGKFGEILRTLQKLKDIVKGEAIGVWTGEDKTAYFDVVETYSSLDKALQIAKQRGELAIYNRETQQSINVH